MTGTMPNTPVGMTPKELADLMEANGITTSTELAARLGVNQSTAWRWLNGERRIDRAAAALIRSILPSAEPKQ